MTSPTNYLKEKINLNSDYIFGYYMKVHSATVFKLVTLKLIFE